MRSSASAYKIKIYKNRDVNKTFTNNKKLSFVYNIYLVIGMCLRYFMKCAMYTLYVVIANMCL